jgi:Cyanate permease
VRVVDKVLPRRKIFYGWWVVLVCTFLNFFAGGTFFYGCTLFFNPIRKTFGWTAAITSVAFAFQRLEMGIGGPLAGFLVDRVGPRKLLLFGWSFVGLGFLLLSRINSLWAFYSSFVIVAIGFSFGAFLVIISVVASWFIKHRSRAMALIFVGFGASGIIAPLLAMSIEQLGWRTTLVIIAIAAWVICLPLCLMVKHKPSRYGYVPDCDTTSAIHGQSNVTDLRPSKDTTRQDSHLSNVDFTTQAALKTRAYWLITFFFFFQHAGTSAVAVHIVPYLESVGIPTMTAATAVTGLTLCSLIGRLGFGLLGDVVTKRYLLAISITLQAFGVFILSYINVNTAWLLIPTLLIYGTGYGGPLPLRPALIADYFGTIRLGTIMGIMSAIGQLSGLASPVLAGWVFDVTGGYHLAWYIIALFTVPAIPLILLANPPRVNRELIAP